MHAVHPNPSPSDRLRTIFLVAGLVLLVVLLLLPAPSGLSTAGWRTAAVAILMALWWITEALPLPVTALLPLVLFPALGVLPSRAVASEYGHHLVFLFLGGFMLAIAMERWNLHRRIALGLVVRVGTRPRRLVLGFLLASAFLSAWISNTATTLMLLPIAMAVVGTLTERLERAGNIEAIQDLRESLGPVLMLALAYGASVGGLATLVGTPPNIVMAGAARELFPELPEIAFGRWMLLGVPVSVCMLCMVYLVLLRFGVRGGLPREEIDRGGREVLREEQGQLGSMSEGEIKVLAVFCVTVLLWLTRQPLSLGALKIPGWSSLFPQPSYLHDATVAIAAGVTLCALSAFRPESGQREAVLDWKSVRTRTPWGILILFGGGFALASGFHESGLASWIGSQLEGLRGVPLPLVIGVTCLITTFLTEVTSNTATSTMLMPILAAVAVSLDAPPLLLMVPAALSASCAFMLPVATPPNAIVFGSGWVGIRQMARVGLILNLLGVVIITTLCWFLAPLALGAGAR